MSTVHAPLRRPTAGGTEAPLPTGSGTGGTFGYLRRSAEDRSGRPLHAQTEAIRAYVSRTPLGDGTVRAFFADNGVSGTANAAQRPGLSALLEAVDELIENPTHRGRVDVVVYDATRLARSPDIGSAIKRALEDRGVALHLAASGMVVSGSSAELLFGVGLQMASSERAATISRIRNAFRYKAGEWDPRGGFGFRFNGPGTRPTPIPEEQAILAEAREMIESGVSTTEVARRLQAAHGNRRCRGHRAEGPDEGVPWTGRDVKKMASSGGWKLPGITAIVLGIDCEAARARGETMEQFLAEHGGVVVDGVPISRGMLKIYFPENLPDWRRRALRLARAWVRNDRHSIDDIAAMLTDQAPRPGAAAWARQTAWDLVQRAEHLNACEDAFAKNRER